MSKRGTTASVICIILGSSAMLGSPIVNYLVDYMIEDNVDEILLAAKEEAIPIIIDFIDLINFVETIGFMYDPSPFEEEYKDTGTIFDTLFYVMSLPYISELVVLKAFFDKVDLSIEIFGVTIKKTFSEIIAMGTESYHLLGISEWVGKDLNFGAAKYNLIRGTGDLPGICDEVYKDLNAYSPEGGWSFLKLFNRSKGNPEKEQVLANGYGTSWYNIEKLVSYYYEYYIPYVVPQNLNHELINLIYPIQNLTKDETANYFFYMQWANLLILENGLDLSEFDIIPGAPSGVLGLEAGYPEPMEMNISKIEELWDKNNPYAIVNDNGNRMWRRAIHDDGMKSFLREKLELSPYDMDSMIRWQVRLTSTIIPVLGGAYLGLGTDLTTLRKGIQIGLMLFGIAFNTVGIAGYHRYNRIKRDKNKNIKNFPKKIIVKKKPTIYKGYTWYK